MSRTHRFIPPWLNTDSQTLGWLGLGSTGFTLFGHDPRDRKARGYDSHHSTSLVAANVKVSGGVARWDWKEYSGPYAKKLATRRKRRRLNAESKKSVSLPSEEWS